MKEEKFNDNTLNEFSDAIEKFINGYDTKKNHVHIFCVIAEEHGKIRCKSQQPSTMLLTAMRN